MVLTTQIKQHTSKVTQQKHHSYQEKKYTLPLSEEVPTALVHFDLSVASDTIDQSTLLGSLLSWFGLCGMVVERFTS